MATKETKTNTTQKTEYTTDQNDFLNNTKRKLTKIERTIANKKMNNPPPRTVPIEKGVNSNLLPKTVFIAPVEVEKRKPANRFLVSLFMCNRN